MNCNEAVTLVAAYADSEIDGLRGVCSKSICLAAPAARPVPEPAGAACADSRGNTLLSSVAGVARAGARLARSRGRGATVSAAPRDDRWRWLTGGALAGCTATMLAWVLGTAVIDWRTNDDLAIDAVATHVRATLGNHLIEVASSDQHTVKPWLSARLDYSPPVQDLAQRRFRVDRG